MVIYEKIQAGKTNFFKFMTSQTCKIISDF